MIRLSKVYVLVAEEGNILAHAYDLFMKAQGYCSVEFSQIKTIMMLWLTTTA
jgi:hypothetical protein